MLDKVTEHQLYLETVFSKVREGPIFLELQLDTEVAHVVKFYFFLLVSNHEGPGAETELIFNYFGRENVVMVLNLPLLLGFLLSTL